MMKIGQPNRRCAISAPWLTDITTSRLIPLECNETNSLQSKVGVRFGNSIIADGSGLSRHNLMSPQNCSQSIGIYR